MDKDNTKGATALANKFKGFEETDYSFKGHKIYVSLKTSEDNYADVIGTYVSALNKTWQRSKKYISTELSDLNGSKTNTSVDVDKLPIKAIFFEWVEMPNRKDVSSNGHFNFLIKPNSMLGNGKDKIGFTISFVNGPNGKFRQEVTNKSSIKPSDPRIELGLVTSNDLWKAFDKD